jgi:hypothetical protein
MMKQNMRPSSSEFDSLRWFSTHFSTNQWYIWVALVLPDGEAAQIKIEEKWLLPAVLELIPEEYEVDYVSAMSVK